MDGAQRIPVMKVGRVLIVPIDGSIELRPNDVGIGISQVAALLPLAASFDNPDQIRQIVLLPPYTHGGGPGDSVTANWNLILPLVHQYFP